MNLTENEIKEFIDLVVSKTNMFDITKTALIRGSNFKAIENKRLYELIKKYKGEDYNTIIDDYNPKKDKE